MAEYGVIYKKLWLPGGRFMSLDEDAQRLLIYIFSSPDSNMLGLYRLKLPLLAFDWKWSPKRLEKGLRSLASNGYVDYDPEADIVIVNNWFSGDPPAHRIENPNQTKKALAEISEIPRHRFISKLITQIENSPNAIGRNSISPLLEGLQKRLPEQLGLGLRESESESEPVSETETETEDILSGKPDDVSILTKQVIEHLNTLTGQKYQWNTVECRRHIPARIKEGATLDDFLAVNQKKATDWLNDPKMVKYLRPSTLYNSEKFWGYVNQRVARVPDLPEKIRRNLEAGAAWIAKMEAKHGCQNRPEEISDGTSKTGGGL